MKKKYLLYCVFLYSVCINAQINYYSNVPDKIGYKILRNTPDEHNNLIVSISPLIIELFAPNSSFSFDIYGQYMYKDKVSLAISYKKAYIDYSLGVNVPGDLHRGVSSLPKESYNSFEITGKFYFYKKNKDTEESLPLQIVGATHSTRTYSNIVVPAKKNVLYGIRLGFCNNKGYIFNKGSGGNKSFVDFPTKGLTRPLTDDDIVGTMQYVKTINIGLLRTTVHDIFIDVDSYGTREKMYLDELYFDLLIAPIIELADIKYEVSSGYINVNANDNTTKTYIGFRLGYNFIPLKKFQFIYGCEIGYKPGVFIQNNRNFYGLIKFGFIFNSRIGK